MKAIHVSLKELGYTSNNILDNGDNDDGRSSVSRLMRPLGQTIDFVIPTLGDIETPSKQLISILGSRYIAGDHNSAFDIGSRNDNSKTTLQHLYNCNNQLRTDAIDEFVSTEKNYIRKLQALVNTVIKPLKLSCAHDKQPILKQYMCANIFLNLEQILDLHQHFLKELVSRKSDFAALCSTFMAKMERYRRYLLKVNDAHELHSAEYQKNHHYRSFITKAITNPVFEKLSLKDLLDQPWKRITAYTLLIKDIRNCTSTDHPDFAKLTDAFTQINTIASVWDDVPTILATKSHDLYLSIRKAPCHLIKQNRTLVTHLDAIEINRITGKLSRYVTLFLFCDKIMVTSRSPHAKGVDICGDDRMTTGSSPLAHLVPKKKKGLDFKFCGWVDLQHIDLFHGLSDVPASSIVVRASSDFQDSITETGYEKYFQKGARIFTFQSDTSQQTRASFIQQKDSFVDAFYKTRAVKRQYGNQDATYHRTWNGVNVYSNLYNYTTYRQVNLKNNVAAILLNNNDPEADISSLLNSSRSSPWIVVLVRPDSQGLKLCFWTKFTLTCTHQTTIATNDQQMDFATVFWNNVIKCEQKLRCSRTYRVMNDSLEVDEAQRPIRSRSRSLSRTSISNSTSISNISKFFSRSRSQPPFSSSTTSSSLSSSSSPSLDLVLRPSKSTPSQQHSPESNNRGRWKQQSRSQSISGEPLTPASESTFTTPTPQRRKLSFDASFFKIDLKSSFTPPAPAPQKPAASIDTPSTLVPQSTSPTHVMNLQASNPIDYAAHSLDPPSYPKSIDPQKQRQLINKLDAMYHDMAGISMTSRKSHQEQQKQQKTPRYALDPLLATCPGGSNSLSSAFKPPGITGFHGGNFDSTSSRSPSFTNTLSSYTSQSSLSSLSLEEPEDICKGYGPSPHIVNDDSMRLSSSQLLQDQMDDEIARRMISGFASSKKAYAPKPKALSSPYTSSKHHPCDRQERSSPTPMATLSTPMSTMVLDREAALDDISDALNHCSSQVYSGWHLLLDKQRMLGNQVNHIAELLPSGDLTDANILAESYRETMDESAGFFNKINTELEEISNIVKAYRQRHQQHRNSSIDRKPSNLLLDTSNANSLLDRKLKEVQLERDYWRHRANELTNQARQILTKL